MRHLRWLLSVPLLAGIFFSVVTPAQGAFPFLAVLAKAFTGAGLAKGAGAVTSGAAAKGGAATKGSSLLSLFGLGDKKGQPFDLGKMSDVAQAALGKSFDQLGKAKELRDKFTPEPGKPIEAILELQKLGRPGLVPSARPPRELPAPEPLSKTVELLGLLRGLGQGPSGERSLREAEAVPPRKRPSELLENKRPAIDLFPDR